MGKANGVLRLPPGFRFHPTDEELVVQYLKRKVHSFPLPASIIPEADVCKSDPWDLPGEPEQEKYFFSTKEVKYPKGNRSNPAAVSGYWKATGLDKQIVSLRSRQIVGMKKTLVFYRGKPPNGCRTDWVMHEYRLHSPTAAASPPVDWVLCRVFLKRRGMVNSGGACSGPVFYDFMSKGRTDLNRVPANSLSGSSGLTQISKADDDEEEDSSSSSLTSSLRRKQCYK